MTQFARDKRPVNRIMTSVIGIPIDIITWDNALSTLQTWASLRENRYVCICNVHSLVTAKRDLELRSVLHAADLIAPDGAPVAWILRKLGHAGQERINGPDLMWRYCELAQTLGDSIFLYGSSEKTLSALKPKLLTTFPKLKIVGLISPPFRPLTPDEDKAIVNQINGSGAGVVFVSLGCPKQELWMARHRSRIRAVQVGVGAAFDYHAGTLKRAPLWMQNCGLEWVYRLKSEPKRLWKRYLMTNSAFIILASKQILHNFLKKK